MPFLKQLYCECFYDRKFCISTGNIVPVEMLKSGSENEIQAYRYRPAHYYTVFGAFRILRKYVSRFSNETIIDFGCGAGRVMIVAAEMNFKKIIGIEFSTKIFHRCEKNLNNYCRKKKIDTDVFKLINHDVTKVSIEDDWRIFFFYSPFKWLIYEKVLEKIEKSISCNPRKIFILEVTSRNRRYFCERGYSLIETFDDTTGEVLDIYTYDKV